MLTTRDAVTRHHRNVSKDTQDDRRNFIATSRRKFRGRFCNRLGRGLRDLPTAGEVKSRRQLFVELNPWVEIAISRSMRRAILSLRNEIMKTAQKVYTMLGNESLWDVAARCHRLLTDAGIAYSVCGGVAVCLHGYQRNTTDLDLVIRSDDSEAVRRVLTESGYAWDPLQAEFRTQDGIAIQFLIAGQRAGRGSEVSVSEPMGELNVEQIEGLFVVRLSRLIEMKIACGESNLRRTHKDFADVVELISIRNLDGSFARFLHKSLRPTFRELLRNATSTDDE